MVLRKVFVAAMPQVDRAQMTRDKQLADVVAEVAEIKVRQRNEWVACKSFSEKCVLSRVDTFSASQQAIVKDNARLLKQIGEQTDELVSCALCVCSLHRIVCNT